MRPRSAPREGDAANFSFSPDKITVDLAIRQFDLHQAAWRINISGHIVFVDGESSFLASCSAAYFLSSRPFDDLVKYCEYYALIKILLPRLQDDIICLLIRHEDRLDDIRQDPSVGNCIRFSYQGRLLGHCTPEQYAVAVGQGLFEENVPDDTPWVEASFADDAVDLVSAARAGADNALMLPPDLSDNSEPDLLPDTPLHSIYIDPFMAGNTLMERSAGDTPCYLDSEQAIQVRQGIVLVPPGVELTVRYAAAVSFAVCPGARLVLQFADCCLVAQGENSIVRIEQAGPHWNRVYRDPQADDLGKFLGR